MAKITDPKGAKCQEAIRLKYEGETYPSIAKQIKEPLINIKKWFATGGLLKAGYEKYRDEQNEIRKNEAEEILKKNLHTAASMLVALMASADDGVKLKAAKEVLDRLLGKPKETLTLNNAEQLLKELQHEKIIDELESESNEYNDTS